VYGGTYVSYLCRVIETLIYFLFGPVPQIYHNQSDLEIRGRDLRGRDWKGKL
jgi:hypothetical protein